MLKLLPVILAVLGIGGGVGAGIFLKPSQESMGDTTDCIAPAQSSDHTPPQAAAHSPDSPANSDFVKMSNQFVVPVVADERISSLIVLSLSLEVAIGSSERVYQFEPKLRDGFLQVLFDHANIGGFRGAFTEANNMAVLRRALLEIAQKSLGSIVKDVLITEIARQDT